jgi:hypothetical protein
VVQDALRHELGLAVFAMHRAARRGRVHAAVDQGQRGVELIGEIFRPVSTMPLRDFSTPERGQATLVCAPYALHGATIVDFTRGHSVVQGSAHWHGNGALLDDPLFRSAIFEQLGGA